MKGAISNLTQTVSGIAEAMGKIQGSTERMSNGMDDVQKFANLFMDSSQKRGETGKLL
jgi:hypothetical protein